MGESFTPGAPVIFQQHAPAGADQLVRNVRHALSLGLPELRDFEYPREETLSIIANGPSAREAPLEGVTLALNGALRLFTDRGLAPTFWAACDPQPLVAEFLKDAPEDTVYLVASKCDPSVFQALVGRRVVLWHVHEEATAPLFTTSRIAPGVSITICAFELMARLGYRAFETWGWDGCLFEDREQHAIPQAAINADLILIFRKPGSTAEPTEDAQEGDRVFHTSRTWAHEAEDAVQALRGFPFDVTIHGGGYIGAFLELYLPPHFVTAAP
jgi:hypothetical protein